MMRFLLVALLTFSLHATTVLAQQQPTQQQSRGPAAAHSQVPPAFQLNAIEQTYLDQVLLKWEQSSAQVNTFSCPFRRWTYNAFSPSAHIATTVEDGQISYQTPDKGSFQITKVMRWQAEQVPPGFQGPPQGKHVADSQAIGEHWVCDGKAVYEYKQDTDPKQLLVRPIPPHLQGQSIVDGPLPFLFGAKADKLKQRFFMKLHQVKNADGTPNTEVIHLAAVPKTMADAVEYQMVEIQLDRASLMPLSMNIIRPDASRNAYLFYKDKVQVNARMDRIKWGTLFATPRTPRGWKRVIDAPTGPQSAALPKDSPR